MIELDALLLHCGTAPERGKERWLREAVVAALTSGDLPSDSALPGARRIAEGFGLARGTVVRALDALADEGYLAAAPRQGYRTRSAAATYADRDDARTAEVPVKSPGVGDLSLFPRADWRRALRHAVDTVSDAELGYPSPQGTAELREAVAGHLGRVRGAVADPAAVVVVAGAAQGLTALVRAAARQGLTHWQVEAPAPHGMVQLLEHHGALVTRLPVDDQGIVPPTTPQPGLTLLTPSNQAPTGVRLSAERRTVLLEQAEATGSFLVEDDYDGDLPPARERVAVLQARAPGATFVLGSVSKTLAPALRLGWVVAPPGWVPALVAERSYLDLGSPVVEQLALAHLITSGAYDRHLRRIRPLYAERRDALRDALTARGVESTGRRGVGLHVFVPLQPEAAARVVEAVALLGVPGAAVLGPPGGVSLGCARVLPHRAEEVAAAVASACGPRPGGSLGLAVTLPEADG